MSQRLFISHTIFLAALFALTINPLCGMDLQPKELESKPLQEPPSDFANKKVEKFGSLNDYADKKALLDESLSNAPQIVREIIAHLCDPTSDKSALRQMVLVGPTGCGKSLLTRAIAHALNRDYLFLASTDLLSSYRGGTEKNIRGLFQQLNKYKPLPVLILDEISCIGGGNRPQHKDQLEALAAFCSLLDEQPKDDNFIMLGTTCDPEDMTAKLRSKCTIIEIPHITVTPQIILNAVQKHPKYSLAPECDIVYLQELALRARIFSIRGISSIVHSAKMNAQHRNSTIITADDLNAACEKALYNRAKFTSLPMK